MSGADPVDTGPLTPDLEGLRRLERRIVRSATWKSAGRRLVESAPAILQIVVAALASYAIAHFLLGHVNPVMAVTVVFTSLGFNRDARPVRVLQSVLGITLGVGLASLIVALLGNGWWQLAVVLVIVMGLGRLVVRNPAFPVAAAVPAALSVILPPPELGPFERVLDALVGAALALIVTALIPRDPRRVAARDGRALVSVLVQATNGAADALRLGDPAAAELALARLRRTETLVASWRESLESAIAIARLSPFLRSRLPELDRARLVLHGADAAARHLRLIVRRSEVIVHDGARHEALADLVGTAAEGIRLLGAELDDLELAGAARNLLTDLARRLHPERAIPDATVAESTVVVQLRPLVVDLLVATGLPLAEAQGRLAPL